MMNKISLKIFICFVGISAVIATILLLFNFAGIMYLGSDTAFDLAESTPQRTLKQISENLTQTKQGFKLENYKLAEENWCILLDENGDIIWSVNQPEDIPAHYSLNDVARMTHWFLNDYPIYVRTEDYGLLVLGLPKNAVAKYEVTYSMAWFADLPKRIIIILAVNFCFAVILALVFGSSLYRRLRMMMKGINDLQQEKNVRLKEKGIFKEVFAGINRTAEAMSRKNAVLAARDAARLNWISGISHDIRTPLSLIVGYSEELAQAKALNEEEKKKAETILTQGIKINKLVEDLNVISALEYDMQPNKRKTIRLCPLIRKVTSEIINSNLAAKHEIILDLKDEKACVAADENLLERAVFNIINNSIKHNENGCRINIIEYTQKGTVYLLIADNGSGVPQEVLDKISKIPKTTHGLGLPLAYKIIHVHGGKLTAFNNNGFTVKIELPQILAQ